MKSLALTAAALLAGCASQYTTPSGPTATLTVHMENDSRETNARVFWASAPADESCKDSKRLATTLAAGAEYTSEPVAIAAGARFLAAASYTDARFGQNGLCTGMVAFTPAAGRQYLLDLAVKQNVGGCQVGVYDTTEGQKTKVPFELPAMACRDGQQIKNGQPMWIQHRVTF
ncbi:MAG: hypothetical protein K0R43_3085 [Pseudoduganella sp.]|jgi:hypothetical protein|nr:hypothetical protein [Pseudoduganella sp.]